MWEELHWVHLNRLGETDRAGSSFETSVEILLEGLAGGRTLMRVVEAGFPSAGERDFHLSGLPTAFERVARFVHERFTGRDGRIRQCSRVPRPRGVLWTQNRRTKGGCFQDAQTGLRRLRWREHRLLWKVRDGSELQKPRK